MVKTLSIIISFVVCKHSLNAIKYVYVHIYIYVYLKLINWSTQSGVRLWHCNRHFCVRFSSLVHGFFFGIATQIIRARGPAPTKSKRKEKKKQRNRSEKHTEHKTCVFILNAFDTLAESRIDKIAGEKKECCQSDLNQRFYCSGYGYTVYFKYCPNATIEQTIKAN